MKAALILAGVLGAGLLGAAPFEAPPPPARFVTDQTGFLSPDVEQRLNARLESYQRETGRQVIVWVGAAPVNASIEEWAARTFEAWGVGKKGKDDGAAIFIFPDTRQIRIETGYGLEETLTDAVASQIIREQFVPHVGAGDANAAVIATVSAVLQTLGDGAYQGDRVQPQQPPQRSGVRLGVYAVLGVLVLILFITHPRLAFMLLFSIVTRGHGGGGGFGTSGGGGFSGGGGRSGGGGASGSW